MTIPSGISTSRTCEFCGQPLQPVLNPYDPSVVISYLSCGCDGAKTAEAARQEAERAESYARSLEAHERDLIKSGMPQRYWSVPSDGTYLGAVESGGLFIHGPVGRGKTHLACATMRAWMRKHGGHSLRTRAVFTDANEFFAHLRKAYDDGDSESEAMNRYASCGLLIWDDFGKGRPSEWSLSKIEHVVNFRYNNLLPIIFTSQWSGGELVSRLEDGGSTESAEAIVSRIVGTCQTVHLEGLDRRRL